MPFSRSGFLYQGGWAIETYWHNWWAFGRTFGKDFRLGPLRLLFGTCKVNSEMCGGNCLLLYTPSKYR